MSYTSICRVTEHSTVLPSSPSYTLRYLESDVNVTDGMTSVAVLPGWHGVAEATPKKPRATPQATPNENVNFGTIVYTLYI